MSEMYSYQYPHPAVTTDCVIFGFDGSAMNILLVERGIEPFKGSWALPGGFLKMDETVEQGALRELHEETGVTDVFLEQFHVFSDVKRDPRERVLTVAFLALVRKNSYQLIAGDDASEAEWFEWNNLPPLAFDHADIIQLARKCLQQKLRIQPIAFKLLNNVFKMSELQLIYELIHGTTYDRRNFARKMQASGFVHEVPDGVAEELDLHEENALYGTVAMLEKNICYSCDEMLPKPEGGPKKQSRGRTATLFTFNEEEFEKAQNSQDWRKFPLDF
ncbi:MAG: NUDIX hydrolase [Salinivirgaceae bacterium]|nr:NUDIX hydrolase [Salinivirgaceae bacterium]